jgi:hypothetical protein
MAFYTKLNQGRHVRRKAETDCARHCNKTAGKAQFPPGLSKNKSLSLSLTAENPNAWLELLDIINPVTVLVQVPVLLVQWCCLIVMSPVRLPRPSLKILLNTYLGSQHSCSNHTLNKTKNSIRVMIELIPGWARASKSRKNGILNAKIAETISPSINTKILFSSQYKPLPAEGVC